MLPIQHLKNILGANSPPAADSTVGWWSWRCLMPVAPPAREVTSISMEQLVGLHVEGWGIQTWGSQLCRSSPVGRLGGMSTSDVLVPWSLIQVLNICVEMVSYLYGVGAHPWSCVVESVREVSRSGKHTAFHVGRVSTTFDHMDEVPALAAFNHSADGVGGLGRRWTVFCAPGKWPHSVRGFIHYGGCGSLWPQQMGPKGRLGGSRIGAYQKAIISWRWPHAPDSWHGVWLANCQKSLALKIECMKQYLFCKMGETHLKVRNTLIQMLDACEGFIYL